VADNNLKIFLVEKMAEKLGTQTMTISFTSVTVLLMVTADSLNFRHYTTVLGLYSNMAEP